ncbi:unnamed protein product [Polarella glacialis]|uniref:Uncharacterized protein n=1 Tax=Polarella glacialis TaxID=89957 RepID=A0A813DL27_POLGL|nr:unnamed protein product [Polarella glacialis]
MHSLASQVLAKFGKTSHVFRSCLMGKDDLFDEASAKFALHYAFQILLESLEISDDDLDELHRRTNSLSIQESDDWIRICGFKTWPGGIMTVPCMKTPTKISKSTFPVQRGMLIPARNSEGFISGLQIKPHTDAPNTEDSDGESVCSQTGSETVKKTPKYMWVSRNRSMKLPVGDPEQCGEDPLFVCRANRCSSNSAFLRWAFNVIGASGGQHWKSKEELTWALAQMKVNKIIFVPDAGAVQNHNVILNYFRTFDFLTNVLSIKVHVAWWGQYDKHDDLDGDDHLNGAVPGQFTSICISCLWDLVPCSTRDLFFGGRRGLEKLDLLNRVLDKIGRNRTGCSRC